MSEQQPSPEPDEQAAPADFDAADRQVIPASVRRAPKFAPFIATGAIIGVVAGLLCGFLLPNSTGVGRGTVALLVASGFAVLGVVIGGVIAVMQDRGTPRELKAMKEAEASRASDGDASGS
ncbi:MULTISPECIES: hypothetical protein [Demequina]|uniref:Uncharacterized protein n=1 Tax=Demequina litorisediminis TaxID=1849022 RepID=A0ABQ6IF57_9MICO|nr:hypothetical protein [Demequina litorisediminis]GMA35369.1 hypothetical protein GCM10025876_15730 [Demequina litorisediminis]